MDRLGCATALVAIAAVAACGGSRAGDDSGSLEVVTAFYPLEFAVAEIGGATVAVEDLTPSGAEPHDLEVSSGQVRAVADADLVVYLGGGFQPAIEDVVSGIDASRRLDVLDGLGLVHASHESSEPGEIRDPHVWLDPVRMSEVVERIAARLGDLDATRGETFEENARALVRKLSALDRDFSEGLSDCRDHAFVTSHDAFGYLAERYGLEQIAIAGIDPEAEPSPAVLADVADSIEEQDITTVFFEELAPADLAETLARETGANAEVLSTLETQPERGDYFDVMRANLDKLEGALGCE